MIAGRGRRERRHAELATPDLDVFDGARPESTGEPT